MAQLSVPTSLKAVFPGLEPTGLTMGNTVTNVGTNPIETDPTSNQEIELFGASNLVDAVDDDDENKFFRAYNTLVPPDDGSVVFTIAYQGQTLSDPGVDTDHRILLLFRRNGTPTDITEVVGIGLYSASDLDNPVVFESFAFPQDTFALIEIPLDAGQVQDFRSKGGYVAGPVFYLGLTSSHIDPDTPNGLTYDTAYVALEVPEGGDPPDLELTGNVTVDISLNEENALVEVEIDASSIYQPSDITSTLQVDINSSSEYGQNVIDGNVTLEIGIEAIKVLSTDPSGLYVLVQGKRNDTIYLREQEEATVDVEIPDPFIKTAYFGG